VVAFKCQIRATLQKHETIGQVSTVAAVLDITSGKVARTMDKVVIATICRLKVKFLPCDLLNYLVSPSLKSLYACLAI
jgi:hypothetical protein